MNSKRRARLKIESIEDRIAPASVLTFTDIDGDTVRISSSVGDLDGGAIVVGGQLRSLDLTAPGFQGANISTAVTKSAAGDGLVNIGFINATGRDLGSVTIKGDLGRINAGDSDTTSPALKLLSVRSMGCFGPATQGGFGDLRSDISGELGSLRVGDDIFKASIDVTADVDADAKIASISIRGSLIGGATNFSGRISAEGNIGTVKIGRDLIGGDSVNSGQIEVGGDMGGITIGGSIIGASGNEAGVLDVSGDLGTVTIRGNLIGGTGLESGSLSVGGKIGAVTIGGSLLGGAGRFSGLVFTDGSIGRVKVAHDLVGGRGDESGKIVSGGKLGSLMIGGSLHGGSGAYNTMSLNGNLLIGQVCAIGDMGSVNVVGNVQGNSGVGSGTIKSFGSLSGVNVGGSVIGGSGTQSAIIQSANLGPLTIGRDLQGGSGVFSGRIEALGKLTSIAVGGSVIGGSTSFSGGISSYGDTGAVSIGHDVLGGSGSFSGLIDTLGKLDRISIGGSLIGGSASFSGGITSVADMGAVNIGHDLIGGSISSAALNYSGFIESEHRIASVTIGGSIIAGIDASAGGDLNANATIRAGDDIGSLTVRGGLIGNVSGGGVTRVIISARGQETPGTTTDVAIGKITIGGRVEYAQVFAGYDRSLSPKNPDAQIGAVKVGGEWAASSIIAGAINLGADDTPGGILDNADNVRFGNLHDAKITSGIDSPGIISRIGSITIDGQVFGTPKSLVNGDGFGFVAEQVGTVKLGGRTFALEAGPNNDGKVLGRTNDMTLHEIQALIGSTQAPVASAKLVNSRTMTYSDIDGDRVTVTISKPLLTTGNVNNVFNFDHGLVGGPDTDGQQLRLINLSVLATDGLNLIVTVTPGHGDGVANIGYVRSTGFDVGTVTIPGDLGQIDAGNANLNTPGVKALSVRSLGRLGLDTQHAASAFFVPSLQSEINGGLGSFNVKKDLVDARLDVAGSIGPVTIGGSLLGGNTVQSGVIFASEIIGAVRIGQHVQGGSKSLSGVIYALSIASLDIGGSLIGGQGIDGATIIADAKTLGAVKIGHNVIGGTGEFTAGFGANISIASVNIGGSFLGGIGDSSGKISTSVDGIGAIRVGHNVASDRGRDSGIIDSAGQIASLSVGGSVLGGSGETGILTGNSGQIFSAGDMGLVRIWGNLSGGNGTSSGTVRSRGTLASASIGGSLLGGAGAVSGLLESTGAMGPVTFGGNLVGGRGEASGFVFSASTIAKLTIGGSIIGGAGSNGNAAITSNGALGPVSVRHDILGGIGEAGGKVESRDTLAAITVGGSVIGGSGQGSARITSEKSMGPVRITGDLVGGSIAGAEVLLFGSGSIQGGRIASVDIGGSIIAGFDASTNGSLTANASIRAVDDIGTVTVKGSLIGNSTPNGLSRVIISARGQKTLGPNATVDMAIKRVNIGGRVELAQILAGYDTSLTAKNGNGSIGVVSVGGDWIASDAVAGVRADSNSSQPSFFGDADDEAIFLIGGGNRPFSRIGSVAIHGVVGGSVAGSDHYGFVAEVIGSFKSGGFTAVLNGERDVIELSTNTGDVTIREV